MATTAPAAPRENTSAEIAIDPRLLADFRPGWNGWVIEKGDYTFSGGLASRALLAHVRLGLKQRYLLYDCKPGEDVF